MTSRLPTRLVLAIVLLGAASCDTPPGTGVTVAQTEALTPAVPLTPSGPPVALTPNAGSDDRANSAASVVKVEWVAEDGAKLFGTAEGDPAMNGLRTWIAFPSSPAGGWTLYSLGDILDYTVLSSATGRVDLELKESTMDQATGEIGSRTRKVIVTWTPGVEEPPSGVQAAPAT